MQVSIAYVATASTFPDVLAAGPAAAAQDAPILMTGGNSLAAASAAELDRLDPGRIIVLGGSVAVAESGLDDLAGLTAGTVSRIAGRDRYETAASISAETFSPVHEPSAAQAKDRRRRSRTVRFLEAKSRKTKSYGTVRRVAPVQLWGVMAGRPRGS